MKISLSNTPQEGVAITLYYSRNTESSTKHKIHGDFGQKLEPAGEYMNVDYSPLAVVRDNQETGTIRFKNPLVLEHKDSTSRGWKWDLSERFGGKTGKILSAAIIHAGFDGIITWDNYGLNETVNLAGIKG